MILIITFDHKVQSTVDYGEEDQLHQESEESILVFYYDLCTLNL